MKRPYRCSVCGDTGHNSRTCAERPYARPFPSASYEANHPGIMDLLGQVPDSDVASKYGISRQRVHQIRSRLGIPSYSEQEGIGRPLTEDEVALLGTMPDCELAEVLGCHLSRVGRERKARGIPRFHALSVLDDRMAPIKDQLGKVPDSRIARMVGIPTRLVLRYRNFRGIPTEVLSPQCAGFEPVNRDEIARLFYEGKTDAEIAEALGSTPNSIRNIRARELRLLRKRSPRTKRHTRKMSPEQLEEVVRLYAKLGNMAEVARQTGWSYGHIRKTLSGVSPAPSIPV